MLVDWGVLAATTATFCVRTLASLGAGSAWREKVEPAFKKSGLDHELTRAFNAGFQGFVDVLKGPFDVDDVMDARLREMFADAGFQEILAELPRGRFEDVDAARARELFRGLGLPGSSDAVFEVAWAALGRRFRDQIAQTTHAAKLVELGQWDRIEGYLAGMAGPRRDESAVLAAYRRYLYDLYLLADTRGLFWREKETTGEEIHLADIFVETLVQRRDSRRRRLPEEEDRPDDDGGVADRPDEAAGRPRYLEVREEPQVIAEVLAKERRLVILGPPGSGKSTLVRCLALALAAGEDARRPLDPGVAESTVPILLTLKTYASRLAKDPTLKLDVFVKDEVGGQLPDLEEVLDNGRALVLLDGLDEVFDEKHRRWVSDEVSRLMSLYGKARFVLTSRPHGYQAAPLRGPVPLFDLVPFDDDRIGCFFRGWFVALASQGLDVERGRSPEERAAALTRDVLARPRIRALAENPMLSTLIVLVHRSRSGRLPERRVKFYEAAVAVLAEHWERLKRHPDQKVDFPEPETLIGVLSEVAWRAQTELGEREIPADVLEEWLLAALAEDPEWTGKRQRAVGDFLKVVQERTGLLVDAGGGRYQFVHLSLQEYLVARYLLARLNESECCRVARHFLHAPEWEEILRLAIGAAPRVRADALVRAILAEPSSEWEERIRRDLRFVCRCLEDRPDVGEAVRGEVERRWLEAMDTALDVEGLILDGAGLGLTAATRAAFEARLSDDDGDVRRSAVLYFAKIGADDAATRVAVQARLSDDDGSVRAAAVDYFAKIGAGDAATRAAVEGRLSDDPNVGRSAVEYFVKIGADAAATHAAFEARLSDDDWSIRRSAVDYFAKIGADDAGTRAAVEARLADDDGSVRAAAVDYFAKIGADDAATRATFEARLSVDDWGIRRSAVDYFAKIGADDAATRAAVEGRLSDDDWHVRRSAVDYFAKIGADDAATRATFEARLSDDDSSIRRSAVEYFAKIGANDVATRTAVEARLSDDDWSIRRSAVEYFAEIRADDAATHTAVEARLSDDQLDVRAAAGMYLVGTGLRDRDTSAVLDALTVPSFYFFGQTAAKLSDQIGRLAATDDALLTRITREPIPPHFDLAQAFRAAAARRDELRRESTSWRDVLLDPTTREHTGPESVAISTEPLRITRLSVTNLRVFDDLSVELSPGDAKAGQWTLLLGDNAVGKTTLLRIVALACVEEQTAAALLELTGASAPFVRHGAATADASVRTSAGEIGYSIFPNATSERIVREKYPAVMPGPVFAYGCQRGTALGGPERDVELRSIDNVGTLFDDNAHLIHAETWLQKMRLAAYGGGPREAFFEALRATLIAVLPGVDAIDTNRDGQVWIDGPKVGTAPLAAMSDGYVTTVGWIVDLVARWAERSHRLGVELDGDFREEMTGLVLIDEIDLHLHPLWQVGIVSDLRRQFPRLSFIATTHNPLTLLGAGQGEIHVLRLDPENGRVVVRRQDIPPGTHADDVLTGEWFGLISTLDHDTQRLLDEHRNLLRDGVGSDDPRRKQLETELRRRLGTFPTTALDRMVQSIATELIGDDFSERTPEQRRKLRQKILELARKEREEREGQKT